MKLKRKRLATQRKAVDRKLKPWLFARGDAAPRSGWLRAIRESLGLSARQLAERMGTTLRNVQAVEEREVKGTVTLESLERAARAMDCRLVYSIVPAEPRNSLEDILKDRAVALAKEISAKARHSMALEGQGVGETESDAQVQSLAEELVQALDLRLWKGRP